MASFKVSWEINIEDVDSPLEAAIEAQNMLKSSGNKWQFYVQEDDKPEVYSVDLEEDEDDAVLEVKDYAPIIAAQ